MDRCLHRCSIQYHLVPLKHSPFLCVIYNELMCCNNQLLYPWCNVTHPNPHLLFNCLPDILANVVKIVCFPPCSHPLTTWVSGTSLVDKFLMNALSEAPCLSKAFVCLSFQCALVCGEYLCEEKQSWKFFMPSYLLLYWPVAIRDLFLECLCIQTLPPAAYSVIAKRECASFRVFTVCDHV